MNATDDSQYLDPVFLKMGQRVFRYDYIQQLRKENLELKRDGKKLLNLIPQAGFQEKVLLAEADIKIVGGKRGGGKAISVDSLVVTPFGYRRFGDLKVGDIISNPATGGRQEVLQIFEHPNHDLYEVLFDDGSKCECGLEHLWKVRISSSKQIIVKNGGNPEGEWRIMTFEQIKRWLDEQAEGKHYSNGYKKYISIPLCEPIRFAVTGKRMWRNNIDPYIIGAIIGDGCITESVVAHQTATFTCALEDKDIVDQFVNGGIDMSHYSIKKTSSGAAQYRINDSRLEQMLEITGLNGHDAFNKFVPERYKWSTPDERLAVLQGLMDTDGTVNKGGKVLYYTVSNQLAQDVRFLVESLGGNASIIERNNHYTKDNEQIKAANYFEVYIKIPNAERLFRLTRKKERVTPFNGGNGLYTRKIISYRYIGKKDARCITVSGPSSIYAIQDFIVTHNTWVGLFEFLPYIFNPDVAGYGFRKFEDDIARGIWRSSKQVFKGFGQDAFSFFEWKFLNGRGATFKCEHLQDPKKISDRFRGVEMAYILIEELAEHTRDNMDTLFDLLASNRSTAGVKPKCVCTCNPVGKSNKLRYFLDWYIDPSTDTIIPERDGKIRYFYRYGDDVQQIAWGNTWEEVYNNPVVTDRIDRLCEDTGQTPKEFITSLVFIEGSYADNEILHAADPKYINRIAARGGESTTNDIVGVWRDVDAGTGLVSSDDILAFYENTEQRDGIMRASADVALTGDLFIIYALDGHHVVDLDIWVGMMSDNVIPFIENFLSRNGVRKENFTFDANGLGLWIAKDSRFTRSKPFNNKSAPSDPRLWNNLKSEAAEKFVQGIKNREYSIDPMLLNRTYTDGKGHKFTFKDRFMVERMALKRKDDTPRFEIISKPQMKTEIGHSPDLIEGLFMVAPMFDKQDKPIRRGFENWRG